jgi:hypothetical protein
MTARPRALPGYGGTLDRGSPVLPGSGRNRTERRRRRRGVIEIWGLPA